MDDDTLSSMKNLSVLLKIDSVIALFELLAWHLFLFLWAKSLHFLPAWDQKFVTQIIPNQIGWCWLGI